MPNGNGKTDDPQPSLDLTPSPTGQPEAGLPPVVPPQTSAPFQFNQQVNIQQIPPKVWERLTPEQIVDLSKTIVSQVERMDKRHYELALERAKRAAAMRQHAMLIGGSVALAGIAATTYLASHGDGIVAGILGTFLATILSVVVGNRLMGD
jgi:hypothetical protein